MTSVDRIAAEWDENAADWADGIRAGNDVINEQFGIPCFLDFIGPVKGLETLDVGCGEGRSSRHLAGGGAQVTGIDISPAMLAHAIAHPETQRLNITYTLASGADLTLFPDNRFELISSYMALMDMSGLAESLKEMFRVTRPGGRVAIAIRHPCFFTARSALLKSRDGLIVSCYFSGKAYQERWRFPGKQEDEFQVTRFPYTLTDYANALIRSGYRLSAIAEPRPLEELCQKLPALNFWHTHAALFLFLLGSKPK